MNSKLVGLLLFFWLAAMSASTGFAHGLAVSIPFDFIVGDDPMPAGCYFIEAKRSSGSSVLTITNARPGKVALVSTRPPDGTRDAGKVELLFRRYGETYFLVEVRDALERAGGSFQSPQARLSWCGITRDPRPGLNW